MRDYGKVYSTFWSSATTAGMSDDGKILALYLMTCSHSTIAGVFRLPDGYVSEDLGWGLDRVREGFTELFRKGFANRCETTKWVWVVKHLEWNPPENPNQRKSAAKIASSIPRETRWIVDFMRVCGEVLALEPLPPLNPLETVPEGLLNQKQEQKQELDLELKQDQEQKTLTPAPSPKPAATRAARAPKSAAPKSERPSGVTTWNAYATAYHDRYGAEPVRNAKVSSQVVQLVERLGAEEAPRVAAFYVGHNLQAYVRATHTVDLLLRDAEGLRTQWANGRKTTNAAATQADRTETNRSAFAPLIAEAQAREAQETS